MDKTIEAEVKQKRKKQYLLIGILCIAVLVVALFLMRSFFSTTIKRSAITTAVVEMGNIENTINATGEIRPEFEEVITSPVSASIQEIILDAGSKVTTGQSILKLDKTAIQVEYEKGKFQLESKQNDIRKLKLELDKSYFDLRSNNNIKQLRINSLTADVENSKRLYKAGGGTREDVEKAELNLKVAQLEKEQLENEIKSKQQTMQVEIRESEIAAAIQQNELKELMRKVSLASIQSTRGGVVTWVNKNIGAAIREGEALARIADLSSFKVTGTISDAQLNNLHNGMPAIIRINEAEVRGSVTNIYPAVENGIVTFDIQLNERNNKLLRPNLKVEVFLVTATGNNVMRVSNGPAFSGLESQDIFVVRNGKAERRKVQVGMINFDYVELKDNVKPGDVVITSDMSGFKHAKEITINN
ncbi:efflux RND transporter periplasmic adaptor subunit [Chitinophaga niabensis]|uniref:HlyD family secretion protein n=1 Tax=Chitinophaga niabensis TaxID=536979 RepID=A0A1N6ELX3_9BACT|nr:HlyD family efflux transporter periplasmic adaptor subunit [Chitinophaga niabensis]SIN84036.1 HlyD family secretion protein [Chitinophaga niabensis]